MINKKIQITLLILGFLIVSLIPMEVKAASSLPYRSVTTTSSTARFEKTGDYYIWVKDYKKLYCAKTKNGSATCLKSLSKNSDYWIDNTVITNGNTIYYLQYKDATSSRPATGTIYKTTVNGKQHKKITTIYNFDNICGYYDGKLYYSAFEEDEIGWLYHHTYEYDLNTGKTSLFLEDVITQSSYGKYLITMSSAGGGINRPFYLTDLNKKNKTKFANCSQAVAYKDKVYYVKANSQGRYVIKSYTLSTKKTKTIKTLQNGASGFVGRYKAGYSKNNKLYTVFYK